MSHVSNLPVRQLNKTGPVVKNGKQASPQFANEIEMAWQLYRDQLQRNFELMKIISELQNVIGIGVTGNIPQLQTIVQPAAKPEVIIPEPFADLKSLSLQRSGQLEQVYRIIDSVTVRIDAVQSYLEMLYAVMQLEEVFPDRLYLQMAIPDSTGYRYIRFLQKLGLIKYRKAKITLTNAGLLFISSPLENGEQCSQLLAKLEGEGIHCQKLKFSSAIKWFDKQYERQ